MKLIISIIIFATLITVIGVHTGSLHTGSISGSSVSDEDSTGTIGFYATSRGVSTGIDMCDGCGLHYDMNTGGIQYGIGF